VIPKVVNPDGIFNGDGGGQSEAVRYDRLEKRIVQRTLELSFAAGAALSDHLRSPILQHECALYK